MQKNSCGKRSRKNHYSCKKYYYRCWIGTGNLKNPRSQFQECPYSGRILGGAVIGPHASDLIAELTLAVKNKLTENDLIETIHAPPTTAEAIHEAALDSTKLGSFHFYG